MEGWRALITKPNNPLLREGVNKMSAERRVDPLSATLGKKVGVFTMT